MKAPVCDDCKEPFTKACPGVLWWLTRDVGNESRVIKVRVSHAHYGRPDGCFATVPIERNDEISLYDTIPFDRTLPPAKVLDILESYRFSADDEAWLRETFGVKKPPTTEEQMVTLTSRLSRLEDLVDTMIEGRK